MTNYDKWKSTEPCVHERWKRRRERREMKWLYGCICNAINVLYEPWTCTIIIRSSFALIAQHNFQREETRYFLVVVPNITFFTTSTFLLLLFISFSSKLHCRAKNYFLIHFHFILFHHQAFLIIIILISHCNSDVLVIILHGFLLLFQFPGWENELKFSGFHFIRVLTKVSWNRTIRG
jgi:hypothetical protein